MGSRESFGGIWGCRERCGGFGGAERQEWGLGEQGELWGSKERCRGCRLRPREMPRKVWGCHGVPQGSVLGVREVWA